MKPAASFGRQVGGWLARALAVALVVGACADGSTQVGTPPASLVPVSVAVDTVVTGESTDPPLSVRVEDALGNAIEGTPVRFVVTDGEGSVAPGVAVSGIDGVAEASFVAGGTPGENSIRADVPSAPNVAAVLFTVVSEAADTVLLSVVEGDGQRAEVASQLALPFVIEAKTPSGNPAGGVSVAFELASQGRSAVLTADSVLTDASGRAQTVLTLGRDAGEYRVGARATRGVESNSVEFTATATTTFDGSIRLDSIAGGALVAGAQATVYGSGFSPIVAENDVRIEGAAAQVLDAGGTELTILVPEFAGACLPVRDVGIRALVQDEASNGRMVRLEPREPVLDLAVGEAATLRGPDAVRCIQLGDADGRREYGVIVASTRTDAGAVTSMRLERRIPADLGIPSIASSLRPRDLDPSLVEVVRRQDRPDARIRRSALQTLVESRVPPLRRRARANVVPGAGPPTVGDAVQYNFAVTSSLAASCDAAPDPVDGIVRAVGDHLVLVEDVTAPSGGLTPEEWDDLLAELDGIVVATDTAYFGGYEDIDGNDRVVVLFTPRVNALSGPGVGGIGGFFLPLDLAASGSGGGGLPGPGGEVCPASNEAEILYMVTADPEGEFGEAISKDRALRNARGLVAHELQHLINAEWRVLNGEGGFAAAEEVWLDEALSSLAEEVAGLAVIDRSVGGNLTYEQVANTRAELDAFNSYQLNNFFNLSLYMFDPASATTIADTDPGGAGGLQMRGFGWFFLRWLADQVGGDERALFRTLASGGQNMERGVGNVEQAAGRPWEDLLADFAVALASDDAGLDELGPRFQVLTWEFRNVFASLSQNPAARSLFPLPFPLQSTRVGFETGAIEFNVRASAARYFSLASGIETPSIALAALTPGGGPLSETSEPQITIVRTR